MLFVAGIAQAQSTGAPAPAPIVPGAEIQAENAAGEQGRGHGKGHNKGRHGQRGMDMQKMLDADGNGTITLTEFQAPMIQRLIAADTDKDGNITEAELAAHRTVMQAERMERRNERRAARMISRLDADGDKIITTAELETLGKDRFARMDDNKDGVIDASELPQRKHRK
jgi:Ca2+-binding EF-hand superfamily protein